MEVKATSLDDVFFTLIQKKTKLSSFIEGVPKKADPSAQYFLRSSQKQLENIPSDWSNKHGSYDVPLFRIATLAFSKEQGLEFPLFLRREDAMDAFARLQESKIKQGLITDVNSQPDVQVTSILDLVQLFSTGGFEARALEIYPSVSAVQYAREIMGLPQQ